MRRLAAALVIVLAVAACGKETIREVQVDRTTTTTEAGGGENYGPFDEELCNLIAEFLDTPADTPEEDDALDRQLQYEEDHDGEFGPILQALIDAGNEAAESEDEASLNAAIEGMETFCFEDFDEDAVD